MKLWGKIASGLSLLIAAVLAVIAVVMPEMRPEAIGAAVVLIVVALFGVPAIVRLFMSFTGDEEVLANGLAGSATIESLEPTRWRYNRYYPIVRFKLAVEAGGAAYPIEIKQAVDPDVLEQLAPGAVIGVRVDRENHKKVVIDWQEPTRPAASAPADTAGSQSASHRSSKRSLLPFLRWGFLIFGLFFFRLSCEEGYYEKGGVRVQGIVVQKTYHPGTRSTGGTGGSPSERYVSYRFTTKDGKTLEGRYDVLPGMWQSLKEGGPVTVEYLRDAPETNRVPEQRARSLTWMIMAMVVLGASGVLFILSWRQRMSRPTS